MVFSRKGTITYKAADQNDRGGAEEKARLGLIEKPVSLYYTDKLPEWDHTLTPHEDMTLIVADQPASGTYTWDIKDLVPGVFYRIVATARDAVGNVGQDVSGLFTVDFESPAFTVTANPSVTRSQPVELTVISTKALKEPPHVTVTQQGGKPVDVVMKGEGTEFSGTYAVMPGFDGVASVVVAGKDVVGNEGNVILSGGTFAIGIDPPPKPAIVLPAADFTTASSTIRIEGTTRSDTRILVRINGIAAGTTTPSNDGTFVVPRVPLKADAGRGVNVISLVAIDRAGSESEAATIRVKYNMQPTISILSPKADALTGGKFAIDVSAKDENLDPLLFTYQIIPEKEFAAHGYTDACKSPQHQRVR